MLITSVCYTGPVDFLIQNTTIHHHLSWLGLKAEDVTLRVWGSYR